MRVEATPDLCFFIKIYELLKRAFLPAHWRHVKKASRFLKAGRWVGLMRAEAMAICAIGALVGGVTGKFDACRGNGNLCFFLKFMEC